MKIVANTILGAMQRHQDGKCSYDRALEDVSNAMNEYCDDRPIIGLMNLKDIRYIVQQIVRNKKQDVDKSYEFNVKIHQNEMRKIENLLEYMEHKSIKEHLAKNPN